MLAIGQLADGKVLRILFKSIGVTIVAFVALAWAGWYAFDAALEWLGLGDAMFTGAGNLREVASALLALTGLWLTWRITAMAVIQFYAEDVVHAVEARHYPHAASAARELTFAEQMRNSLRGAGRALLANLIALPFALALLFTGVGTALLFWLVNALLVGRELQDMVWLRHRQQPQDLCPVSKWERFVLGGVVAAMLAVPFVNFLAPVLGAAGAAHLVHRKNAC
ncbi:EI24 domain-containing protein [Alteraurantiacibacter aestuarii]|nr:EI24 domain-containing protein [Alteraurantiacibacter aestuarii]